MRIVEMTFVLLKSAESGLLETNEEVTCSGTTTLFPHQDNASAHRAAATQEIISKHLFEVLEHPPYSPDLASCDLFLFRALKEVLHGQQFDDINELPTAIQGSLLTSEGKLQ